MLPPVIVEPPVTESLGLVLVIVPFPTDSLGAGIGEVSFPIVTLGVDGGGGGADEDAGGGVVGEGTGVVSGGGAVETQTPAEQVVAQQASPHRGAVGGQTVCRLMKSGVSSSDKIRNPVDGLSPEERAMTEPVDACAPAGKVKANKSKRSRAFVYCIVKAIMIIVL